MLSCFLPINLRYLIPYSRQTTYTVRKKSCSLALSVSWSPSSPPDTYDIDVLNRVGLELSLCVIVSFFINRDDPITFEEEEKSERVCSSRSEAGSNLSNIYIFHLCLRKRLRCLYNYIHSTNVATAILSSHQIIMSWGRTYSRECAISIEWDGA